MNVDLPEIYNAATTFVDENITQGRGEPNRNLLSRSKNHLPRSFEKVNRTGNALKDLGIEIENRVL